MKVYLIEIESTSNYFLPIFYLSTILTLYIEMLILSKLIAFLPPNTVKINK